jgi:DNA-binding response OmpR family regulator
MFRILVIEDDPAVQEGLKELLTLDNYTVERASDGITGIEKAYKLQPDLILLDINLPGKGGYDVCRELRDSGFRSPIIILSSKSEQIDKVLGLELGADDYITKPFHTRELLARVHANLRKNKREHKTSEAHYDKKLCTIFFSDMYGYSEKMNRDELSALKTLNEHNAILIKNITSSGGEIIEITGDAFLASFDSASSAVECACLIQDEFFHRNSKAQEVILVRIGIHLGEVFVFSDNLKGDVLNIASRVQQEALPGTVFVTGSVYDVLRNNNKFKMEYKGSFNLKNIEKKQELYEVSHLKSSYVL